MFETMRLDSLTIQYFWGLSEDRYCLPIENIVKNLYHQAIYDNTSIGLELHIFEKF